MEVRKQYTRDSSATPDRQAKSALKYHQIYGPPYEKLGVCRSGLSSFSETLRLPRRDHLSEFERFSISLVPT
jgi:hypothetical protein